MKTVFIAIGAYLVLGVIGMILTAKLTKPAKMLDKKRERK